MISPAIPDNQLRDAEDLARWIADEATEFLNTGSFPTSEVRAAIEAHTEQKVKEALEQAGVIVLSEEGSKNFRKIMSRGEQEGEG